MSNEPNETETEICCNKCGTEFAVSTEAEKACCPVCGEMGVIVADPDFVPDKRTFKENLYGLLYNMVRQQLFWGIVVVLWMIIVAFSV